MAGTQEEHELRNRLTALSAAASVLYVVHYKEDGASGPSLPVRGAIARALAQLVPVYVHDDRQVRLLEKDALQGAEFRDGGHTASFSDGRAPIAPLAILLSDFLAISEHPGELKELVARYR